MHNLGHLRRALWVGVLFLAATALCVDAEAQNQRSRGPARRAPAPSSATNKTTPKAAPGTPLKDPTRGPRAGVATTKPAGGPGAKPGAGSTAGWPGAKPVAPTKIEEEAEEPTNEESADNADGDEENEGGEGTGDVRDALKNASEKDGETAEGDKLKSPQKDSAETKDADEMAADVQANEDESAFEKSDEKYSSEPLDLTATRLPEKYCGHDFGAINRKVASIFSDENVEKDEYEKSADFNERIKKFKDDLPELPLYGDLKFGSPLALALLPNEDGLLGARSYYDADAEAFRIVFNDAVNYRVYSGDERLYGVKFEETVTLSETYTAENGFGVKKEVKKTNFISRGVVYTDSVGLALDDRESLRLTGIAPNEAKKIGDSLGVLCVFRLFYVEEMKNGVLSPNCDIYGIWSCDPTMSSPYDFFELQIASRVSIPEFWAYNFDTGEVYAKYSLKDLKTGKEKKIGDFTVDATGKKGKQASETNETAEETAKREATEEITHARRRAAQLFLNGERSRVAAAKKLKPGRETVALATVNVPKDCADLQDAVAKAEEEFEKKPNTGPIPRIVLDAGEYDASGLTLKTFVEIQSASGSADDVILNVDAANPITVDGETVAAFDGVTLRQIGDAKTGTCVEVKRGIAFFSNCAFDGQMGAKSSTGVKAVGLKSAAVCQKCVATGFSLTALHVEDGAVAWTTESVFGPGNRFGVSSKGGRLDAENCEFRGNDVGAYFGKLTTGGAQGCVYAENKRDAQIVAGAKVEVDAPNVEKK